MSDFDKVFRAELNSQGFGFQHAVVQAIHQHHANMWEAAATEFPVSYRGRSTHIDVLAWCFHQRRALLVGECKRVNPAFGQWIFARSPFTFERRQYQTWLEQLHPAGPQNPVPRVVPLPFRVDPFHVALEVKTKKEGDQSGMPKGRALAQALTQVSEGVNGLMQMLPQQGALLRTNGPIILVPAIFTTADLYVSEDATLHLSSLETGEMPDDATFEPKPWLWFEHNVSPDLLAEIQREDFMKASRFNDLLPAKHSRAVAIVNHKGISSFLKAIPNLINQL